MTEDPFGNLQDWGQALEGLISVFQNGKAENCQRGLIRILRYKGNWRLREEALQHLEKLENPREELLREVLSVLDDENIYYEARIMACRCLMRLVDKNKTCSEQIKKETQQILDRINSTPQPPFFIKSINAYAQNLKQGSRRSS